LERIRETPAQKSRLRETPQAKTAARRLPNRPLKSERLERKSTGKINRAFYKVREYKPIRQVKENSTKLIIRIKQE
jgi:hypothetical protein